jgi:hypothetical protein
VRRYVPLTLAAVLLALPGCAATPPPAAPSPTSTVGDGHGAITGAVEVAEAPLALAASAPGGAVGLLDLVDESQTPLGSVPGIERLSSDGRYLFADTGRGVTVIDSGRWTWDHIDHFHYYLAEPRVIGTVEGTGEATVATTLSSTTGGTGLFFAGSGEAVLIDTEALARGELVELFRLDADASSGLVVPVGANALVSRGDGMLRVHAPDGAQLEGLGIACPDARGTITTRVGAVVGCADGAVLATTGSGSVPVLEKIALPHGTTAPAPVSFAGREGRPRVAALAGGEGIWILDTRERAWSLIPAPAPLIRVTHVDDADGTVLAAAADGRVLVLDGGTGEVRAQTDPLLDETRGNPAALAGVTLVSDGQRAYLNAPLEGRLIEIDYADAARIARTFDTGESAAHFAEVGR